MRQFSIRSALYARDGKMEIFLALFIVISYAELSAFYGESAFAGSNYFAECGL